VLLESLSYEDAALMRDAAIARATELGLALCISVVDAGAHLLCFARQNGAHLGSVDISQRKARTALLTGKPTAQLATEALPGSPVYGIETTNGGLAIFGGGLLVHSADGQRIGAIGVSGGSVEQDIEVATAALGALTQTA
jgi:uncharacterized protein GlcG (DUF336 family)